MHTKTKQSDQFFSGHKLYGDDFGPAELDKWYSEEAEGYADLGAADIQRYSYSYFALNEFHGFSRLHESSFRRALGLGSAYGMEFEPLSGRVSALTILEPSSQLVSKTVAGVEPDYVRPDISGDMPFESSRFDLIVSFGTLHHIANVSRVIHELGRVAANGAVLLLREPCISMGDWRKPRKGLTKNERGIPIALLHEMLIASGWTVHYQKYCIFPLIPRLAKFLNTPAYNSRILTRLDAFLSDIFSWNCRYHASNVFQKIRPQSIFVVARKGRKLSIKCN